MGVGGNFLGQPFDSWVSKQIKVRQKSLGKSKHKSTKDLLYQNSKTPWIRLSSSVDITSADNGVLNKLKKFGFSESLLKGSNVAENFVLFGGVVDKNGKPEKGLNTTNSTFKGAYGWGGIKERGFVPMPGIVDAKVQYYDNGSMSKTSIKMKCYSRRQLALLDVLYMRPGYNLLLEFGWTAYLSNSGSLKNASSFKSKPLSFMFKPRPVSSAKPTHFDVLDLIQEERKKRDGNYEGVFGKITNYHWSFNPDGSYDCTVDIIGMGDMMESLKMNIKLPSKADVNPQGAVAKVKKWWADLQTASDQKRGALIANKNKTTLNKRLFHLYDQVASGTSTTDAFYKITLPKFPYSPNSDAKTPSTKETIVIESGMAALQDVTTDEENNVTPQVYMTFGVLLALIQKYLLIYNKEGVPLFDFDVNFKDMKNDKTIMCTIPGQFSSNPLKCIVPYENLTVESITDVQYPSTVVQDLMKQKSPIWKYETYLSRMMYVYLNMNMIADVLDKTPRDEGGVLSLLSFLNEIIGTFSDCLGGINMISLKLDQVNGKIQFIENTPQRFDNTKSNLSYAKINTFGVKPDTEGSFVRNIVMGGELGPMYASMIVIGAQMNGNKLSANSTGFATYNRGLIDRVIPEKMNADDLQQSTETEAEKAEDLTISDLWNDSINDKFFFGLGGGLFEHVYNKGFLLEDINALNELNSQYISMVSGKLVEEKQLQTPAFLPFNLSLDLDGISGIRLFEKFTIDDRVLPPSYGENSIDLLVKSLNHHITVQSWITTIDTVAAPRSPMNPVSSPGNVNSSSTSQRGSNAGIGNIGDEKSITSGIPMIKMFYTGPTVKTQIYLHHTAGHSKGDNCASTIGSWNKRNDHVCTHFIIGSDGHGERLYADTAWGNHLGIDGSAWRKRGLKYTALHPISLAIEIQALGSLKYHSGKWWGYPNDYGRGPKKKNAIVAASNVAESVDNNLNVINYKGYKGFFKYTPAAIATCKSIVTTWMSTHNIPFHYDYDELFPDKLPLSTNALTGVPGIYTHNSVRTGKSDIFPQKEMVQMLKSIATSGS